MKKIISLFVIFIMLIILSSCQSRERVTRQNFAFDTIINITTDKKDSGKIDRAFELCREYEKSFSSTDSSSELYKLNNKDGISPSTELMEVLKFSFEMSELSDGAFDITVKPLVDLWNVSKRKLPPTAAEIEQARLNTGYEKVSLSPFDTNGRKLDMGAVAKGYIADKLIEEFRKDDIENVIVDLGGNVALIGEFTVGIRNPFNPDEIFATISLKDKSAVTSGAYQRYFEYDGKRYHHIIDPRTGFPAESGIASVTVISSSSIQADALSTTIFILGKDSISLCSQFPDTDALIIMNDKSIVATDNFAEKYSLILK